LAARPGYSFNRHIRIIDTDHPFYPFQKVAQSILGPGESAHGMNSETPSQTISRGNAFAPLEDVLEEMAQAARADVSSRQFFRETLTRLLPLLGGRSGWFWRLRGTSELVAEVVLPMASGASSDLGALSPPPTAMLEAAVKSRQQQVFTSPTAASVSGEDTQAQAEAWLLSPLLLDGMVYGVLGIQLVLPRERDSDKIPRKLIRAVSELATDFEINRQRRSFSEREGIWGEFDRFLQKIYSQSGLRRTAFAIVNEGRRTVACDRLSLAIHRAGRGKLLAVSGVDTFDRRAEAVRSLERLAATAAQLGEPIVGGAPRGDLAPEIATQLDAYVDLAHPRVLEIVPLNAPEDRARPRRSVPTGVLIAESFEAADVTQIRNGLRMIEPHCRLAVHRAWQLESVPLQSLWGLLRATSWQMSTGRWRAVLAAAVLGVVVAVLLLVRAELNVEARGELQPVARRNVFAPCDGDVRALHVEHNQPVQAGQLLIELRSPELDLEFRRVQGELDAARERLRAVESARVVGRERNQNARDLGQLTASQEELKHLLASYEDQLDILLRQREELNLSSPLAGRVLTWDVAKQLQSRPVQRGEALLTVADVQGDWNLELQVSDSEIGHVLDARRHREQPLQVTFILETHPDATFNGELREVAAVSEPAMQPESVVTVLVDFDHSQLPGLRPGATVIAQIHCGQYAVGYVWFRQAIEFFQTHVMF
jgi:multidrug efflux pump subunit AcrA (membrane-fusion protein)